MLFARTATVSPASACRAASRSAAGKTDSAAPLKARTVTSARARRPGQRWSARIITPPLHVVGEAGDVAASGNRRPRAIGRERHRDLTRAVAHVLDGGVDVQRVARIEQRIGEIERDL